MALSMVRQVLARTSMPLIRRAFLHPASPTWNKTIFTPRKFISTTGNCFGKDPFSTVHDIKVVNKQEQVEDLESKDENWISTGYSLLDRDLDELTYHNAFFFAVTVAICGLTFFFMYCPNYKDIHWELREAYLVIEQREKLGLPLINKDLVDPSKFELPSDEELGDFDIII